MRSGYLLYDISNVSCIVRLFDVHLIFNKDMHMHTAKFTEDEKTKNERLAARTTPRIKKLIEEAASLEGRSVSDFMVEHAQAAAVDIIEKHNSIILSSRDSARFIETLLNPPAPNEHLKRAAVRHKKVITSR